MRDVIKIETWDELNARLDKRNRRRRLIRRLRFWWWISWPTLFILGLILWPK